MGVFDIFKKKPSYDSTNITVEDLALGFLFDYDLKSWEVVEEYEYDWGDECFSREFKVKSYDEVAYLSIEDEEELEIIFSKRVKLSDIDPGLFSKMKNEEEMPDSIRYDGKQFFLESENPGFFNDKKKGKKSWVEMISWTYGYDQEVINVEQWSETDFEASVGKYVSTLEISNIIPR